MSDSDLIRRGDVERIWSRPDHYMYPPEEVVRLIRAIPADPVAAAALEVAEAAALSMRVHERDSQPTCLCDVFRKECDCPKVPEGCVDGCRGCALDAALDRFRAAKEARATPAAGTEEGR